MQVAGARFKGELPGAEPVTFAGIVNNLTVKNQLNQSNHPRAYTQTNIGTTGYQLQTNSAICNRVQKDASGNIAATWTMSQLQDAAWAGLPCHGAGVAHAAVPAADKGF